MSKTVKIKIDGKEYEVDSSMSVLQAALSVGVDIPHFCWHEKLSVSGNCRMCLVEIQPGPPKLQISCATPVREGMEVTTNSERVKKARRAMLEFLLINHPLDCPVCDKAYECPLQDYTYKYGTHESWADKAGLTQQKRRVKRKDISDKIFIEMDRCIHCTRCQRYFEEVVGMPSIGRTWRAGGTIIDSYERIEGNFQLNVTDLCPTGALTDKSFRFKARVWDIVKRPSVCHGCSVGCNVYVWSYNGRTYRITPRKNEEVNSIWMCDTGRLAYNHLNSSRRGDLPSIKQEGEHKPVSLDDALQATSKALQDVLHRKSGEAVGFYLSPYLTVEDMFFIKKFASSVAEGSLVGFVPGLNTLPVLPVNSDVLPKTLVSEDHTPNTAGGMRLGLRVGVGKDYLSELVEKIESGEIEMLFVFGEDLFNIKRGPGAKNPVAVDESRLDAALSKLKFLFYADIYKDTNTAKRADVYVPTVSHYEKMGSFINRNGYLQAFDIAFARQDLEEAVDEIFLVSKLWQMVDSSFEGADVPAVRKMISEEEPAFANVDWLAAKLGKEPVRISDEDWAIRASKKQ